MIKAKVSSPRKKLAIRYTVLGFILHSLYRGMHIKATIVAYAFSVQYFENPTIVAYAGLRVKRLWVINNILFETVVLLRNQRI